MMQGLTRTGLSLFYIIDGLFNEDRTVVASVPLSHQEDVKRLKFSKNKWTTPITSKQHQKTHCDGNCCLLGFASGFADSSCLHQVRTLWHLGNDSLESIVWNWCCWRCLKIKMKVIEGLGCCFA